MRLSDGAQGIPGIADGDYQEIGLNNGSIKNAEHILGILRQDEEHKNKLGSVGMDLVAATSSDFQPPIFDTASENVGKLPFDLRESRVGDSEDKANALMSARTGLIRIRAIRKALTDYCPDTKALDAAVEAKAAKGDFGNMETGTHDMTRDFTESTRYLEKDQGVVLRSVYKSLGVPSTMARAMLEQDNRVIDKYLDKEVNRIIKSDMVTKMGFAAREEMKQTRQNNQDKSASIL